MRQTTPAVYRRVLIFALVFTGALMLTACDLALPGSGDNDDTEPHDEVSEITPAPMVPEIADPGQNPETLTGRQSHQVPDEAFQIEPDPETGPSAPVRIVEAGTREPRTLNPILVSDPLSEELSQLVFSGLTRIEPRSGEPVPDLALTWDISPDETIYTFELREGITWHNGQPVTTQDVKFTFDLMMDDRTRSPRYSRIVERVAAVEALDSHRVQFRLVSPHAPFLSTIATFGIVPQHLLVNVLPGELVADPFGISTAIGTGPFVFNRWERAERIVFDTNREHVRTTPAFDQYEYRVAIDESEILAGLRDGSIDWARISPNSFSDAETLEGMELLSFPSFEMISVALQLDPGKTTIFDDPDVRRALLLALDRDAMVDRVWNGHAEVAHGTIPPPSWAAREPEIRYGFDRSQAATLLDEAGWVPDETGIRARNGQPLAFTLVVNGENPARRELAEWLVEQWQRIGIHAEAAFETWGSVRDRITTTREFEALLLGYRWEIDPDAYPLWASDSVHDAFNISGYLNQEVDQLLEEALVTSNPTIRADLYGQVQEHVLHDLPVLPLAFPNQTVIMGPRLQTEEQTAILIRNRANVASWIPANHETDDEGNTES